MFDVYGKRQLCWHESTEAEPQDELYDALAEVLNTEETTKCYKSYFLPSGSTVILCESPAIISEGTTGLVTWEAALFLAEWAIENIDIFRDRTILELGSGIGLTGLAICKSCFPKKYMFSDCHQKVLSKLRENIHLNDFVLTDEDDYVNNPERLKESDTVQLSVSELDWESITEKQLSHIDADVIIAADVVYDPDIITSFTNILCKLLFGKKVEQCLDIFVASTVRNPKTYRLFQTKLDSPADFPICREAVSMLPRQQMTREHEAGFLANQEARGGKERMFSTLHPTLRRTLKITVGHKIAARLRQVI
ncbi:PREDICTED: protein-lysine N-methyltransferase EEF2KMT-like [Nanorana parkeri]|uniref:protein-lysine N-methyltransferase EEF2KMT-like n=1 Tax=Nanorana parkeri TaxID=125878 RepID=UPI0008547EF0|nr:PREDICTED: protein-lysine N-methyltransferase EEF2KMT-like [Nanorana parkeri]